MKKVSKKPAKVEPEVEPKEEPVMAPEGQTIEISDHTKVDVPVITVDIKKRVAELKAARIKGDPKEKAKALLAQLPRGKTAKELGTDPMDYAIRVMASQSSDINIVPVMLAIARVQKALKKQGYALEEVDNVVTQLEEAYKV